MESSDSLSYCYNKGCGQRFNPDANSSDSCVYHPGIPVFHDAYKSWSCCEKKTTDFTEFLGIKGCTKSSHNSQKPQEELKSDTRVIDIPLQQKIQALSIRPDRNLPTVVLHFSVTSTLKSDLEKLGSQIKNEENSCEETPKTSIDLGTSCKNGGCRKTYECEADDIEECLYHAGQPVFHEGLKFWSCCVRRTSDFNCFLEQVGCTAGSHLWVKPKNPEQEMSCRYDWYQTGPYVFVSVYAKLPIPTLSSVRANQILLSINLVFGNERHLFRLDLDLFGVVDVTKSEVTYFPNKVEIKLKKGEPSNWSKLNITPKINQS